MAGGNRLSGEVRTAREAASKLRKRIQYHVPRVMGVTHPAEKLGPSYGELRALMSRYQTRNLANESPESFEQTVRGLLSLEDYQMEGYRDPTRQRDLSIRFHWGHDHDFGTFQLTGRMSDRHLRLISVFIDTFHALPLSLAGKRVLDVGCWTGGTSLAFAAMGAEVVAIEEVNKYVDALTYLKDAFEVNNLEVRNLSLYECTTPEFQDQFDYVLFAGVLYHLTDPILGLRVVFNSLRDGGLCLLETAAIPAKGPTLRYEGPNVLWGGDANQLARSGWNWFLPSTTTLVNMMRDVGFDSIRAPHRVTSAGRQFAVAKRIRHVDILRAGLSSPGIR